MTISTVQPYTPGQVLDLSRSRLRQRLYAGVVTSYTLTFTVDTTGTTSYEINGHLVSAAFTVPPDDANTTASKLAAAHVADTEAFRLANAVAAANVVTISGRTSFDVFTVANEFITAAGTNAVVLADTTPTKTDLELGILAAREGEGAVRKLTAADTAMNIFGAVVESPGSDLKPNTGNPNDEDVYELEAIVDLMTQGEAPMRVESDIAVGDDVWVRLSAAGSQIVGSLANADMGGGTWLQLTDDVVWSSAHYFDDQGRKLANLTINLP